MSYRAHYWEILILVVVKMANILVLLCVTCDILFIAYTPRISLLTALQYTSTSFSS
jgi:hypothetical protein